MTREGERWKRQNSVEALNTQTAKNALEALVLNKLPESQQVISISTLLTKQ